MLATTKRSAGRGEYGKMHFSSHKHQLHLDGLLFNLSRIILVLTSIVLYTFLHDPNFYLWRDNPCIDYCQAFYELLFKISYEIARWRISDPVIETRPLIKLWNFAVSQSNNLLGFDVFSKQNNTDFYLGCLFFENITHIFVRT